MGRTIEQAARDAANGSDEALFQLWSDRLKARGETPSYSYAPMRESLEAELAALSPAELSLYEIEVSHEH